jgi:hypothetical protein
MPSKVTVTIVPRGEETDILVMDGPHEVVRARLGASSQIHRLAMRTLLEGIALWYQEKVRVVLSADSEPIAFALGLSDGFGFGLDTLHYTVEVVLSRERRLRPTRLRGVGDFREAYRQLRLVRSQP